MITKRMNPNAMMKGVYYQNVNDDVKEIHIDANLNYGKNPNANVLLDVYDNGKEKHYDIMLDKNDLENLLQIPTIDKPIDERLIDDFGLNNKMVAFVEPESLIHLSPKKYRKTPLPSSQKYTHISSPLEEILLPLSIRKSSSRKSKGTKRSSKKTEKTSKRTKTSRKTRTPRKSKRRSRSNRASSFFL